MNFDQFITRDLLVCDLCYEEELREAYNNGKKWLYLNADQELEVVGNDAYREWYKNLTRYKCCNIGSYNFCPAHLQELANYMNRTR